MRSFLFKGKPCKLSQYLGRVFPELRFSYFRILLKQRSITVSGKRVTEDVYLHNGDTVEVFADESKLLKFNFETVYRDENVIIAVKPRGISSEEFAGRVSSSENVNAVLAHRLDTNTRGLIVMSLNEKAEAELNIAFRKGYVIKKYVALVAGDLNAPLDLQAYLVKDSASGTVRIYDKEVEGGVRIRTEVAPLEKRDGATLVEVTLHTGKTHQIRAHLAHAGYPVIGDTKYGDFEINRMFRAKRQYLTAYKLAFRIPKGSKLGYLDAEEPGIAPDF